MKNTENISIEKEMKTAFKPAVLFGTGYIFQNFLYFLSTLLIARILGNNNFGRFSLALSITGLGAILTTLGLNIVPSKFIPVFLHKKEFSRLKNFLRFIFTTQGAASCFIVAVIITLSRYISVDIYKDRGLILPLIFLSLLIPLQRANDLLGAVFQGFKKVEYRIYVQQLFAPALRIILLLTLFIAGFHFGAVFTSLYAESILTLIIASVIFNKKIWKPTFIEKEKDLKCDKKAVISYSLPLFIPYMINFLMGRTDILFLGYFRNASDVGIYHIAFKLSLLVYLSLLSLNSIFSPMISELFVKKDHKKLFLSYKVFTRSILYASIFSFGVLVFMAPVLMKIPGAEYITGITPLMILAAGQVLSILAGPASSLLSMTKFPRITFYNSIIQFCLNVILDIVLIPKYGMAGAATATGISLILISIIRIIQIFFLLKIHPFSVSYFKPVLAGSVAFFSVKAVTLSGLSSPFPRTVMFIIIFSAAAFFMGIEKEEKYMFSLLKNYKLPPHNR